MAARSHSVIRSVLSGCRIVLHTLNVLRRHVGKSGVASPRRRGIASICIGGGLGGAMLVEAL